MKTVHLLWLYIYKIICNMVIPKRIERQKTDTCNEYLDNKWRQKVSDTFMLWLQNIYCPSYFYILCLGAIESNVI